MNANFFSIVIMTLFLSVTVSEAQTVSVLEDELSIDVLKWHYSRYPNSQANRWTAMVDKGEIHVTFEFGGNIISAVYDNKGKIKQEKVDLATSIPVSLVHELDEEFANDKYKVTQFVRTTNFSDNSKIYEMEIKSKAQGLVSRKFDSDLIPLAVGDYRTSVSSNN